MKLNAGKGKAISSSEMTDALAFNYVQSNDGILHGNCIKDFCICLTLNPTLLPIIDYGNERNVENFKSTTYDD